MGTVQEAHIQSLVNQMEKVNAERATAVKALQEIEGYLVNHPAISENLTLAYMTAIGVLHKLGEDT